ncbi:hypothetical protein [Tenacibaculum amylolyticum]|uniref:hypothetical protein n=1 Tax=Tenacibaculum amylolyticum TaxID=104269 RepID=UPI003892EAA0
MGYYSTEQSMTAIGVYIGYENGYFVFEFENGDLVDFEEINKIILVKYDLKSNMLKGKKFEILYKEIINDLDDEDLIIFKLEELKLLP